MRAERIWGEPMRCHVRTAELSSGSAMALPWCCKLLSSCELAISASLRFKSCCLPSLLQQVMVTMVLGLVVDTSQPSFTLCTTWQRSFGTNREVCHHAHANMLT